MTNTYQNFGFDEEGFREWCALCQMSNEERDRLTEQTADEVAAIQEATSVDMAVACGDDLYRVWVAA